VTELGDLQRWMVELLRRRRALPRDAVLTDEARQHVSGNDRLSPVEQLEIYREQFWLRHTSALVEDFPGLGGILGQEDWEALVEAYLLEHVPTSFSLRDLGHQLPAFVEQCAWLPHHELCVDMAQLEWAYVEVFDAAQRSKLDAERLAALSAEAWERARCVLSPGLRLLSVRYPVADLRRALRRSRESGESVPLPDARRQELVVYRGANLRLFDKALSRAAFVLLSSLGSGQTLIEACERAMTEPGAEPERIQADLAGWFAEWGELGFIVDVCVEP
jgi:hypothetical protein